MSAPSGPPLDPREAPDVHDPHVAACIDRYWRHNVRLMLVLLAVWAFAGLGCGVVFADWLNQFRVGGFKLGFWFAQQGSIVVFVVLILIYALAMARLDARHHRELAAIAREAGDRTDEAGA